MEVEVDVDVNLIWNELIRYNQENDFHGDSSQNGIIRTYPRREIGLETEGEGEWRGENRRGKWKNQELEFELTVEGGVEKSEVSGFLRLTIKRTNLEAKSYIRDVNVACSEKKLRV